MKDERIPPESLVPPLRGARLASLLPGLSSIPLNDWRLEPVDILPFHGSLPI